MDFKFSKSEKLFQSAVKDFAKRELADRDMDTTDHIPKDLIEKIGDLGFLGLNLPKENGGVDANWFELGILIEEMAKTHAAFSYFLLLSNSIGLILANYGTEEIKTTVLSKLISGEMVGSIAITEQGSGCDISSAQTTANHQGKFFIINGRKSPVSFGGQADFTILLAKTPSAPGIGDVSAFLIPLDQQNITRDDVPNMGLAATATTSLNLDDVHVPEENRLGVEGDGSEINTRFGLFSNLSRVLSGLICIGMAQRSLDMATFYANKRIAFGRPIAQFQGISHKIAEDETLGRLTGTIFEQGLHNFHPKIDRK